VNDSNQEVSLFTLLFILDKTTGTAYYRKDIASTERQYQELPLLNKAAAYYES
jgi:hypothetical protein